MTHAHARFVARSVMCARDLTGRLAGVRVRSPPGSPLTIMKPAQVFASSSGGDMSDDRTGARAPNGIRARAGRTPRDDAQRWAAMVRGTRDWRPALLPPPVRLTWNCITPGDRR